MGALVHRHAARSQGAHELKGTFPAWDVGKAPFAACNEGKVPFSPYPARRSAMRGARLFGESRLVILASPSWSRT